jgi:Uma2 family endonuclease
MMSPEVIMKQPKARIPKQKLLTYADYVLLTPPDSGNYELHNGQIIYMPSPIPPHQKLSMRLSSRLFNHTDENKLGEIFTAPMDVVFNPIDTFQPDIFFLSNDRLHLIGDKKIEGAPDLVVEILSPSNNPKEMGYKKVIYEMSNVKEYWIINLKKQILTQYENIEGEFISRRIFQNTDTLTSITVNGFEMPMSKLFE